MESGEWEETVQEFVYSLKHKGEYSDVQRCGGAGDMGRDVIGYVQGSSTEWDNFQCKAYDVKLSIAVAVKELAKLCYYVDRGDYTLPRKYRFVAPLGAGTALNDAIKKGTLRQELKDRWDKECANSITSRLRVELNGSLLALVDSLDFSFVDALSPRELLERLQLTPYYAVRFGEGLPDRPAPQPAPETVDTTEVVYVRKLLDAYSEKERVNFDKASDAVNSGGWVTRHFNRSREQFYSAESLRAFSRDNLPPRTFNALQDEYFNGVQIVYDRSHPSGLARLDATLGQALSLIITNNPLMPVTSQNDKYGICHQLANDNRLTWCDDE
jgi:hypothetical protein